MSENATRDCATVAVNFAISILARRNQMEFFQDPRLSVPGILPSLAECSFGSSANLDSVGLRILLFLIATKFFRAAIQHAKALYEPRLSYIQKLVDVSVMF